MKSVRCLLAMLVLSLLAACAHPEAVRLDPSNSGATSSSVAARRILVAFADRSIERPAIPDPANRYRSRGDYRGSTWAKQIAAELAGTYKLRQVTDWPITELEVHCVVYELAGDQSVERVTERLSRDERIELVQPMNVFRVLAQTSGEVSDPYRELQASLRPMQIEAAHRRATGAGVSIALIDTGVDLNHPDLVGQIARNQNFAADVSATFSEDIHGTAVAGVIAALADNGKGIVGIAPGAELIALKACWAEPPGSSEAVCNSLTLALALNSAIRVKAAILNMSLTGPDDPLLSKLIDKAIQTGMIVVAADPGEHAGDAAFPASHTGVIAVRVARPETVENVTDPSWVSAPGLDVLTTLPRGAYNFMSGSSFAAAHIGGVAAMLLELEPHLPSKELLDILQHAAIPNQYAGKTLPALVNACLAVARLRGSVLCESSQAFPVQAFRQSAGAPLR